jgi:hypothetical protein
VGEGDIIDEVPHTYCPPRGHRRREGGEGSTSILTRGTRDADAEEVEAEAEADDPAWLREREVDTNADEPPPRLALAFCLLNSGGGVKPYLV